MVTRRAKPQKRPWSWPGMPPAWGVAAGAVVVLLFGFWLGLVLQPGAPSAGPLPLSAHGPPAHASSPKPFRRAPRAFYVHAKGHDEQPGTKDRPWRSLDRVNRETYGPGDEIVLQSGQTFLGSVMLSGRGTRGSADRPVTIHPSGSAPATILSGNRPAIQLRNVTGVRIAGLALDGSAEACGETGLEGPHGIVAVGDGGQRPGSLRIKDVDISGFCVGVAVFAHAPGGYTDVLIERVTARGNLVAGIALLGTPDAATWPLRRVAVTHARVIATSGATDAEASPINGAGIVVDQAQDARLERNVITANGGAACASPEAAGRFGLAAAGQRLVIQANEIAGQRQGPDCGLDGGGLLLAASDSIVQYNYTHDNDGPGLLLAEETRNAIVRYNISRYDARRAPDAGQIAISGGNELHLYNNTVIGGRGGVALIRIEDGEHGAAAGVWVRNNLLAHSTWGPMVVVPNPDAIAGLHIENNLYWPSSQEEFWWGQAVHRGVASWSEATGQERLEGELVARRGDPKLCAPDTTMPDGQPLEELMLGRVGPGSAAAEAGWELDHMGGRDFFGNPVPSGRAPDVGAHEHQDGQTCGGVV